MNRVTKKQYENAIKSISEAQKQIRIATDILNTYLEQNNLTRETLYANLKIKDIVIKSDFYLGRTDLDSKYLVINTSTKNDIQRIYRLNSESFYINNQRYHGNQLYTSEKLYEWFKRRGMNVDKKKKVYVLYNSPHK